MVRSFVEHRGLRCPLGEWAVEGRAAVAAASEADRAKSRGGEWGALGEGHLRAAPPLACLPAGGSPAAAQVRTCLRRGGTGRVTSRRAGSARVQRLPAPRAAQLGWLRVSARRRRRSRSSSSSSSRSLARQPGHPATGPRRCRRPPPPPPPPARPARPTRSPRAAPRPPSRPRRVHAAAIPPSAMARALQDGRRRAEPTAAVSGGPAFPMGGTVALPPSVCRPPLALSPGLNCIYRRRRGQEPPRRRSSSAHGALQPSATAALAGEEGAPPAEAGQGLTEPNGHLSALPPATLEQAIGACLRRMGDQFQQDYELREPRPPRGALWGHFYHLVFHLLGVLYNRPVRG